MQEHKLTENKRNTWAVYIQGVTRQARHTWKNQGINQHEKLQKTTNMALETGSIAKVHRQTWRTSRD